MSTTATLLPLRLALEIHREYITSAFRFWAETLIQMLTLGVQSSVEPVRTDKPFKDEAWQATPYFDLLKQRPRRWRHQSTGQKKAQSLAE
jgi:hypothetical protein